MRFKILSTYTVDFIFLETLSKIWVQIQRYHHYWKRLNIIKMKNTNFKISLKKTKRKYKKKYINYLLKEKEHFFYSYTRFLFPFHNLTFKRAEGFFGDPKKYLYHRICSICKIWEAVIQISNKYVVNYCRTKYTKNKVIQETLIYTEACKHIGRNKNYDRSICSQHHREAVWKLSMYWTNHVSYVLIEKSYLFVQFHAYTSCFLDLHIKKSLKQ